MSLFVKTLKNKPVSNFFKNNELSMVFFLA